MGKKGKEFYDKIESFVPEDIKDLVQKQLTIIEKPKQNLLKRLNKGITITAASPTIDNNTSSKEVSAPVVSIVN